MHCSFLETLMLELILAAITEIRKSKGSWPLLSLTNGKKDYGYENKSVTMIQIPY